MHLWLAIHVEVYHRGLPILSASRGKPQRVCTSCDETPKANRPLEVIRAEMFNIYYAQMCLVNYICVHFCPCVPTPLTDPAHAMNCNMCIPSPVYPTIKQEELDPEPAILDLRVRRPGTPDYTLNYPSPNYSPLPTEFRMQTDSLPLAFSDVLMTNAPELESASAYEEFKQRIMAQMRSSSNTTNTNMRRKQKQDEKSNDPVYLEKRKKNNEAAKRSRDARRAKEDEIAIRCAFLEQENMRLKIKLASLESEAERLRKLTIYNH
ncbi:hypothetical protein NQ318_006209 [Aromia moschata]|uniref:BZIP domain-containing protein n=1 Tax=Aromia moschata TaxID=1265417 RepID=A0AAV8YGM4_9CUCU|nr:hypothetical protein NQ318_006209 [Aromia moschata]